MPPSPERLAHRPARASRLRLLAVAVFAIAAAAQIFATQVGTISIIGQQPVYGVRLPFAHARPLALWAEQLAFAGVPGARVKAVADAANRGSPIDAPAFAALARALGPDGAGSASLDQAWRLSRRDPWVVQAMFDRAHAHGDSAGEIAALAAQLQLQLAPGTMRETLVADMAQPAAFAQGVAALRAQPRWRRAFFAGLRVDQAHVATVSALIAALRQGGAPLSGEDMTYLLGSLAYGKGADPAVADAVWRAWLGPRDPWAWPAPGLRLPFDWVPGDHAHMSDDGTGPVLDFSGTGNRAETLATKPVYLGAGRYRFVARAGHGLNDAAITATLDCDAQHVTLTNGAVWQTDRVCRNARLNLQSASASGTIIAAGLRPEPGA